jgi:hypothetical protein
MPAAGGPRRLVAGMVGPVVRTKKSSVVIITPRLAANCLLVARNGRPSGRERLAEATPSHPSPMTPDAPRPFPSQWAGEDERMERSMTTGNRVDSVQTRGLTIPNAKPPALLEESRCSTYAEDLPDCVDRSKHHEGAPP